MNIRNMPQTDRAKLIGLSAAWRPDVPLQHAASAAALAIDTAIIVLLSVATGTLSQLAVRGAPGNIEGHVAVGAIVSVLFCGMVRWQTPRRVRASATRLGRTRIAAVAWLATFLFLVALAFSMKISAQFSRSAIFTLFTVGLIVVSASRAMTPRFLARWMASTAYRGMEVIILAPAGALETAALHAELAHQGCTCIRAITFDDCCSGSAWVAERRRVLQDTFNAARSAAHGEIYVFAGQLPYEAASGLMSGLRLIPRAIHFVPSDEVAILLQYPVRSMGLVLALEMQKTPMSRVQRGLKRAMDIAIAGLTLIFILPLLAALAVAVKLSSAGPVFFRQTRLGHRGRPFEILKFRTMTVLEDGERITQASRNDQRVTRVGGWLRRSSLDELPQLWNVLKGEMSIVGPRPHAAAHDAYFAKLIENYEVRQHVKPGITGWAQVHGLRGETPVLDLMYRRIEMDLWYASNCTLALDVQILFKTIGAVLGQVNAY